MTTTPHPPRPGPRCRRALLGFVGALTVGTGGPLVAAAPAAAAAPVITGLQVVTNQVRNDAPAKVAVARCPSGKKVVGGGGYTDAISLPTRDRLKLTGLWPSADLGGGVDGYSAAGAETSPGVYGVWGVVAHAVCADAASVPGWNLRVSASTTPGAVKRAKAGCESPNQRVIGTGARAVTPAGSEGQVGLQVARVSAPGDIARAQAHVDANGYSGFWYLAAYAICADTPAGYEVKTAASELAGSIDTKFATVHCPVGKQLLSAGAAVTDVAPGNVSLITVSPSTNLRTVYAAAVENTPTSVDWDVIIARAVCVTRPPT